MRTVPFLKTKAGRLKILACVALLSAPVALGLFQFNHETPRRTDAGNSTPISTTPSTAMAEVSRTNLVLVEGRLRQLERSHTFTGFMVEHYPDGHLLSRSAITNGLLHGLSQGWRTNGQLQITEQFKEGISHGPRVKWYSSGAKQSEANIADGKLNGPFRKWHENGSLSEQIEFDHGEAEGTSVSYFPSGCLKARVVMKDAKPIQQEFWKDGEKKG